jgi:hypothetical protein
MTCKDYIFFQNLIGKNHFAMTLYVIGSIFPDLAARDRVNEPLACVPLLLCNPPHSDYRPWSI